MLLIVAAYSVKVNESAKDADMEQTGAPDYPASIYLLLLLLLSFVPTIDYRFLLAAPLEILIQPSYIRLCAGCLALFRSVSLASSSSPPLPRFLFLPFPVIRSPTDCKSSHQRPFVTEKSTNRLPTYQLLLMENAR